MSGTLPTNCAEAWRCAITLRITGDGSFFYGYHWWLGRSLINRREIHWSAGFGYGGQRLFIVPELDIVVVCTAGRYDSALRCDVGSILLHDFVLSVVRR